jgi:hypothetical protein
LAVELHVFLGREGWRRSRAAWGGYFDGGLGDHARVPQEGSGFAEDRADAEIRPCPKCGFKLWPKGNVRHVRFHDLRHTYASVLLMFGANLTSVQKLLGHSDPKITERRYGHLLADFMRSEVDRLRFGLDRLAPRIAGAGEGAGGAGSASQPFAPGGAPLGSPSYPPRRRQTPRPGPLRFR